MGERHGATSGHGMCEMQAGSDGSACFRAPPGCSCGIHGQGVSCRVISPAGALQAAFVPFSIKAERLSAGGKRGRQDRRNRLSVASEPFSLFYHSGRTSCKHYFPSTSAAAVFSFDQRQRRRLKQTLGWVQRADTPDASDATFGRGQLSSLGSLPTSSRSFLRSMMSSS